MGFHPDGHGLNVHSHWNHSSLLHPKEVFPSSVWFPSYLNKVSDVQNSFLSLAVKQRQNPAEWPFCFGNCSWDASQARVLLSICYQPSLSTHQALITGRSQFTFPTLCSWVPALVQPTFWTLYFHYWVSSAPQPGLWQSPLTCLLVWRQVYWLGCTGSDNLAMSSLPTWGVAPPLCLVCLDKKQLWPAVCYL